MNEDIQELIKEDDGSQVDNPLEKFSIPIAIVIAGIIIAGAVLYQGNGTKAGADNFGNNNSPTAEGVRPVDEYDHVRGNPDARVAIVEFSDFECPFCARFHPTLARILEESPEDVKWIYRHFPLTQIHAQAEPAAFVSECIADLAGNDAFWEAADELFANQSSLGSPLYERLASDAGISAGDLATCIGSDKVADAVGQDLDDALASGGNGTPYVIVINGDGDVFPFSGALPYDQVRSIIDGAIAN